MKIKKAIIISLSSYKLSSQEIKIFKKYNPWGVILFRRNIKNYNQVKKLTSEIKKVTNDKNYPILIDEEGGKVSRLKDIINNQIYSQESFGNMYETNYKMTTKIYEFYINKISNILKDIGININTVPVLDRLYSFTNIFLKGRVYSSKLSTIKKLGKICVQTYKKNKIGNVIKHIPGHGLGKTDSHKKLPIINKKLKFLIKNDFNNFKDIDAHFAMTAHILYKNIDKEKCVTHSKKLINIIRKKIRFRGIIISDDISMKSLKLGLVKNALTALNAGCNLALYCKGNYKDSIKLLKKIPPIDAFTIKKTSEFYKFLR